MILTARQLGESFRRPGGRKGRGGKQAIAMRLADIAGDRNADKGRGSVFIVEGWRHIPRGLDAQPRSNRPWGGPWGGAYLSIYLHGGTPVSSIRSNDLRFRDLPGDEPGTGVWQGKARQGGACSGWMGISRTLINVGVAGARPPFCDAGGMSVRRCPGLARMPSRMTRADTLRLPDSVT